MDPEDPPSPYTQVSIEETEELPRYHETTLMDQFIGFPNKIQLVVDQHKDKYYPKVYIRSDTSVDVLVQVDINIWSGGDGTIGFQNSAEQNFLTVKPLGSCDNFSNFQTFHNDMPLGTGEVLDSLTMNLSNSYENRQYIVSSVKVGEINVKRSPPRDKGPIICQMHLPRTGFGSARPFALGLWNGHIFFPGGETVTTRAEQCLCISLALVFLIRQSNKENKGLSPNDNNRPKSHSYGGGAAQSRHFVVHTTLNSNRTRAISSFEDLEHTHPYEISDDMLSMFCCVFFSVLFLMWILFGLGMISF